MRSLSNCLILTVLAASACASDRVSAPETAERAAVQKESEAHSGEAATGADAARDLEKDLALLASQERIRPANFYRLERSYEPETCDAALKSLNRPYAVPEDLHTLTGSEGTPMGDRDYASRQAAYYLGTSDNVRWSWRAVAGNEQSLPTQHVEVAFLDLYGDGSTQLIVRDRGMVSSAIRLDFAVRAKSPPNRNFDYDISFAVSDREDFPDRKNLMTKLDYSVKDLIDLAGRYRILIMPLEDFDKSGRVYLAAWRERAQRAGLLSRYAEIVCTFMPSDS